MDQPEIDEGEVLPRFLLVGPAKIVPAPPLMRYLTAILESMRPAAVMFREGSTHDQTMIDQIAHCSRDHGAALLAEDDIDLASDIDGVHLTDAGRVPDVRRTLDHKRADRSILGADVGLSRHEAMVAGEGGADYVAFGKRDRSANDQVIELIAWWQDIAVLPCLAYAADPDTVTRLAGVGADFIGVSSFLWDHPVGPVAAAHLMNVAINKA